MPSTLPADQDVVFTGGSRQKFHRRIETELHRLTETELHRRVYEDRDYKLYEDLWFFGGYVQSKASSWFKKASSFYLLSSISSSSKPSPFVITATSIGPPTVSCCLLIRLLNFVKFTRDSAMAASSSFGKSETISITGEE